MHNPNWIDHIQRLFTQFEAIKMRNIGQQSIDLRDYDDVRRHWVRIWLAVQPNEDSQRAAEGWSRIAYVRRMPLIGEFWSDQQIELFQTWAKDDFPYDRSSIGAPPKIPEPMELNTFIRLSEIMTGFDDLAEDSELAQAHLRRLKAEPRTKLHIANILTLFEHLARRDEDLSAAVDREIVSDAQYGPISRILILLWYTGAFFFDEGSPLQRFTSDFGTPADNQYRSGLVWRAIHAHPQAYSVEDNQYWQYEPQPSGRYTGRLPEAFRARALPEDLEPDSQEETNGAEEIG